MAIIEHMSVSSQGIIAPAASDADDLGNASPTRERPPIGALLKNLRGERTLRQVETDTGISNAYLCNLELGTKKPGVKTLSKLAAYYRVPLQDLLYTAGTPIEEIPTASEADSIIDVQRGYDFVLADPGLSQYQKPSRTLPLEVQKFVVQMYQHYTGKKLL